MRTVRAALSLNHLVVLTIVAVVAFALAWRSAASLYIETQRENILAQARLIASAMEGEPFPDETQTYSQAANVAPGIHTRLLTEGGAVIVGIPLTETNVQAPPAEQNPSIPVSELIRRPEIESAIQGIPATEIRTVMNNRRVLYAAAPVYSIEGKIAGVVYIASPLPRGGLPLGIFFQLVGALILASFAAALAGSFLARKISLPLEELTRSADAISRGDLERRASLETSIVELNNLAQTFNAMAENLQRSDATKKAFIADVTHELRTPLTVIKGTIETLEDGALDDREGRGALLSSMSRETERLIRLVNETLLLTRADAGILDLNLEPIEFGPLLRARCRLMESLAARKSLTIQIMDESQSARVNGDADKLSQVIDNLLDNAIRHAPQDSTIQISLRQSNGEIKCEVNNSGAVIPHQRLPFIFERFYRVDSSRNRADGGAGLGLAIVRALVNAHGGRISAQSDEAQGTTITLWIPTLD